MARARNNTRGVQAPSLIEQLKAELHIPPPPPGWYTVSQLTKMLECSQNTVEKAMREKGVQGRVFKTTRGDGRLMTCMHYNLE